MDIHFDSHKHFDALDVKTKLPTIVLAGNPNVGKSVFFNFLSGMYVDVSNYPGTTIELTTGHVSISDKKYLVIDTPGVYGVSSFNDEETAARDVILDADIILNIVDGVHLERDLFLTQQLIDMGKPIVVAINFMDEVRKNNLTIDINRLSSFLGVPVIGTTAVSKEGFEQLLHLLPQARAGVPDDKLHHELHTMLPLVGSQAEALMILEGDEIIAHRHGIKPGTLRDTIYIHRRNRVNEIFSDIVSEKESRHRIAHTLGRLAVGTWTGIPLLLIILSLLYLFIGDFVAQKFVSFSENQLGHKLFEHQVKTFVARYSNTAISAEINDPDKNDHSVRTFTFPSGTTNDPFTYKQFQEFTSGHDANITFIFNNWFPVMLFGEFGIITMTITYLIFLLLPLVMAFYFSLSLLEDSGYLPRLAALMDRSLNAIGLNGRAIIPIILGFGCVTMATITTRLLGSEREKTIATTILQLAIPCSAQLAVIAALLTGAGLYATILYTAIIFACLAIAGTLLSKFIPGETTPLLIDLPPMRLPRLDNVLRKTGIRSYYFMKEATPWFFLGALAVGLMKVTGLLDVWSTALTPFTVHWLRLPKETATVFVMGLVRRDFGAAGMYSMHLSPPQIVVALVTITLFVPCIASLMVMIKERGIRQAMTVWIGTWILAFGIGGAVSFFII